MKLFTSRLFALSSFALLSGFAVASPVPTLIDFEGQGSDFGSTIANGYAGFNWYSAFAITPSNYYSGTGYYRGIVSGSTVAIGANTGASIRSADASNSIFGISGYFTAGYVDDLVLKVTGYQSNGVILKSRTFSLNSSGPVLLGTEFASGVSSIWFEGYSPTAVWPWEVTFAIDDLTVNPVPEPASVVALGLGGLAMLRRRKK